MNTVLTFTPNPAIDASTAVDRVIAERKLRCHAPRFDPGGGGINVARVIHRLGGDATALFLGGGPTGELLRQLLERDGVANRMVQCEQWTRENVTVLEESSGHQFRFGMPGPEVTLGEWDKVLALLRTWEPTPQFVVASGTLPPGAPADGLAQVARIIKERGSKLVLDASGPALISGISPGVFLVKPNLRELEELNGAKIADEEQVKAAARSIIERGWSEVVVVSLGAGGAYLLTATDCKRIIAPIVPVRSRVGAGDSMVGGIVLALVRGWSLSEAVRFGAAAGAAAVMQAGTELCHGGDVERLFCRRNVQR
jgi:6-phosphofructokinase 2